MFLATLEITQLISCHPYDKMLLLSGELVMELRLVTSFISMETVTHFQM